MIFAVQILLTVVIAGCVLAKIDDWDARRAKLDTLLSNDPQRWDEWTR